MLDTNIAIAILSNEDSAINSDIAKLGGTIRKDQKSKGRKLKTPDALIIATAMFNQLILVSRDADMDFAESELNVPTVDI